ncbi:LptE family protein [uncultured Flavobacterium sp.]|uniref:LptE family protein n=1 Tax=uncultured Flavobacterium sp. TaxID=165435 RepID=UPI0025F6FBF2|nr:LptE family protein [uncultured Flavobacterium sp.]
MIALTGCKPKYTLSGGNISKDVKTFEVRSFQNNADIVEPGIERLLTNMLQNRIEGNSHLNLTGSGGDLVYEGEIVEYRVSPMTATANQRASQNRLTISVMVRFTNRKKEDDDFEKRFSFFYDYSGDGLPTGSIRTAALEEIFERITQDIFNESLAKW